MKKLVLFLFTIVVLPLAAQKTMTPELLWKLGRVSIDDVSKNGDHILYGISNYSIDENKGTRSLVMVSEKGGETELININTNDKSASNGVMYPDGRFGYLQGGQWYVASADGSSAKQRTEIEGGISNVTFNADFSKVFYTTDVKTGQSTLDKYPAYTKANVLIIDDLMYRHWDHFEDDMSSHVFWTNVNETGGFLEGEDVMKGEPYESPLKPFGGAEQIAWSADGKTIAYTSKKSVGVEYAKSTNSDIYLYNTETKKTTNITKGMMGYDKHPVFSPDGESIAWLSMERDGYEADKNNIYIQNLSTGDRMMLTGDYSETVSSFVFDDEGKNIYFLSATKATYQYFSLRVPKKIKVGEKVEINQITEGDHNFTSLYYTEGHLIGTRQDMNHANEIYRVKIKDGKIEKISGVNDAIYNSIEMVKIEKRLIKTTDNKDMLTWVIYPPDFDPNKKYPTLLYCQGGPQSAVSQFYSFRWNFQLMASKGYIVVAPNRRGLPSFGQEWNEAISKDWGGQAIDDYFSAIDEMAKESFVDSDKLGAIGASYGGYSVYYIAGVHEGRFSAFVSHAGLFNLESWYGTTEELFFANFDIGGPYWESPVPESYKKYSPHLHVDKWDTPIMVIHGEKDFRVPFSEGMQAFQVAQIKGIPSKFVVFPEENHWILSPQNGLIWHSEFFGWLDQWLK
jgi:dipeptidyl aminopeptidase/acylaminoacyl peptidase